MGPSRSGLDYLDSLLINLKVVPSQLEFGKREITSFTFDVLILCFVIDVNLKL